MRVAVPAFFSFFAYFLFLHVCVNECVFRVFIRVRSLMSAGRFNCLQLDNHKTQSLWSIPEPLPLYIARFSSTHKLSPFVSLIHKHSCTLYFPFLLCSDTPVLHLVLPHSLYFCVLWYYASLWFLFLCSLTCISWSPTNPITNTSLYPTFSPSLVTLQHAFFAFNHIWACCRRGVLIAHLADLHSNGWLWMYMWSGSRGVGKEQADRLASLSSVLPITHLSMRRTTGEGGWKVLRQAAQHERLLLTTIKPNIGQFC